MVISDVKLGIYGLMYLPYNYFMENIGTAKVAVDSSIAQTIPTVIIAATPPPEEKKGKEHPSIVMLPVLLGRKIINFFMDFLETSVVALSIFVVIYLFFVQPHEIKGNSMEPNFHNNEYILTDKISYKFGVAKRGDVVIFKAPKNQEVDYIKRVIGLPGDRVKVQKGYVYVNGKQIEEPYLKDLTSLLPGSSMQEGVEVTVAENHLFCMGDNRPHSSDSREFGPVPNNLIIGKALFRYWPVTEFGPVPNVAYSMDK